MAYGWNRWGLLGWFAQPWQRCIPAGTTSSHFGRLGRRFGELEKVGEQMRRTNFVCVNEQNEISIEVGGRMYSVVHLTGMFLRNLKNEAEAFLKEPVGGIVVSVPAYFTPQQKVATEDAGNMVAARFPLKRMLKLAAVAPSLPTMSTLPPVGV